MTPTLTPSARFLRKASRAAAAYGADLYAAPSPDGWRLHTERPTGRHFRIPPTAPRAVIR